MILKRSYWWKL